MRGKVPTLHNHSTAPRPNQHQIRAWISDGLNVGLRTGRVSGVFVVDEERGGDLAALWEMIGIPEPMTPTVQTGNGGRHLYFAAPDPCPASSSGLLAPRCKVIGEASAGGGDAQVLYPGSTHPATGEPYRWDLHPDDVDLAPFPVALLDRLRPSAPAPAPAPAPPAPPAPPAEPKRRRRRGHHDGQNDADQQPLPQAPEAEVALLAACLLDPSHVAALRSRILPGHFYPLRHRLIWDAILRVHAAHQTVDMVLLVADLRTRGELETVGGPQYVAGLLDGQVRSINADHYAASVLDAARRRAQVQYAAGLQHAAMSADPVASAEAIRQLQAIEAGHDPIPSDPRDILVPGPHRTARDEYLEVGNDDFAAAVLDALPAGLLYRRSRLPGIITGEAGSRSFHALNPNRLRLLIDQHCRLVKWQQRRNDPAPAQVYQSCPWDLAAIVLEAAATHPAVRDLRLLVNYPVFLGRSITLAESGWNADFSVYYDEPSELAGLDPSSLDADRAFAILEDLLIDFPWKPDHPGPLGGSSSRDNMIGLLLTPLLRHALDGNVPMHLIQSPIERAGKTKLAEEVLGGVILGGPTPALQLSGNEDEREKRVLGLLLRGTTIVHLDNVRDFLDSPTLAALLTASRYQGRRLGASEILDLPNDLTIVASGNNIQATKEIVKRSVPIWLAPATDAPEERSDFRHPNLRAYVRENRRSILEALCHMVIAWRDSPEGRSLGSRPKGGFEAWSSLVGGVLPVHGWTRWRTNERAWIRSADPIGEDLLTFVEEWFRRHEDARVAASQLLEIVEAHHLFPHVQKPQSQHGKLMAFTRHVLSKFVDAPVAHWTLRRTGSGSSSFYYLESRVAVPA